MPTILVNLNPNTTPPTLIIPQADMEIPIPKSVSIQTITWQLTGNAATGVFDSGDDDHPPITWLGSNKPGSTTLFPDPSVQSPGLEYTLGDNNPQGGATQTYSYQLCAKFVVNGVDQYYSTAEESPTSNPTNPKIKNE